MVSKIPLSPVHVSAPCKGGLGRNCALSCTVAVMPVLLGTEYTGRQGQGKAHAHVQREPLFPTPCWEGREKGS